jgi:hypothetical protein
MEVEDTDIVGGIGRGVMATEKTSGTATTGGAVDSRIVGGVGDTKQGADEDDGR